MPRVPHFLDGAPHHDAAGTAPLSNPATGEVTGDVGFASAATVEQALRGAVNSPWSTTPLATRAGVLFGARELLNAHRDELAQLVTAENGKTLADARGEVDRGLENLEYACGLVDHLKGDYLGDVARGVDVHSTREPVGVVLAITPFNFPAMVPLWMCANALAAGNAVVLKPSEKDPSAAVRLAELFVEAGLPPGTMQVVHGDGGVVEALIDDPRVDAVSFVGSTPVAKAVYQRAAARGVRAQALGGAKNHMVVLADADLDVAADAALAAGFGAAGERCMAISVVVVVDEVADAFLERLGTRIDRLVVGDGHDPHVDMGPLISGAHRDRVASYVDDAAASGVTLFRDGRALRDRPGFFLGPTVLDGVRPGLACYDDEIFGPVLGVHRVASLDEALVFVNSNPYGNGAAIFTASGLSARRFSREVTAGMVGVNVAIPVPVAAFSFGGWKQSLFGHAHIYGPEGLDFYTRTKVVTSRWPQSPTTASLNFPTNR